MHARSEKAGAREVRNVAHGSAFARIGLLGNPSDAYRGKAIARSLFEFEARVRVERGAGSREVGVEEGPAQALLRATCARFLKPEAPGADESVDASREGLRVHFESTIPFQVGLSGSSALVIACLRALGELYGRPLEPRQLAEMALAVEAEDLGIAAGPMDRVIQAYEGAMSMDFSKDSEPAVHRRIKIESIPPLLLAWDPQDNDASGRIHSGVRARWHAGDREVVETMKEIAALVEPGLRALQMRDLRTFAALVDRNFDLRCELFDVSARDREMVRLARAEGAAAKLCGSGGAVVVVPPSRADFPRIEARLRDAGFEGLQPRLCAARPRADGADLADRHGVRS